MDYVNPDARGGRDRLVTASMCFIVLAVVLWVVFAAVLAPDRGARFEPGLRVGLALGGAVVATTTAGVLAVMAYVESVHVVVMRRLQELGA